MVIKLKIFTGPMFACKTTTLLSEINNCGYAEHNKLKFNYAKDTRYNNNANITSHTKQEISSIPIENFMEINNYCVNGNIKAIFVDEIQFIINLEKWLHNIIDNDKYNNLELIILAGLNFDVYGNYFNNDIEKILTANGENLFGFNVEINYLQSNCYKCNRPADYTILYNLEQNNNNINAKNNKLVGSNDIYQPSCLNHAVSVNYTHNFKVN